MKFRPTQFGVRENTASPRQHAPRFAVDTRSNVARLAEENPETQPSWPHNARSMKGSQNPLNAPSQDGATRREAGDERHLLNVHEVAELLQVPVSWVYGRIAQTFPGAVARLPAWEILALPQERSIGVG
jgi:predicted DNA-binding transcriptional regulator AlpA